MVYIDGLAGGGVPSCRVPPLPAAIFPLADAALAVGSLFCHCVSPSFQRHTIPANALDSHPNWRELSICYQLDSALFSLF